MSSIDLVGIIASILSILLAIAGAAAWLRRKLEKWQQHNIKAAIAEGISQSLKQQMTEAIHEAIPHSALLSDTFAATRQLYNNGGSTMADKVDKALSLSKKNSEQLDAVIGELAANTTKLTSVQGSVAALTGQFLAHVGKG